MFFTSVVGTSDNVSDLIVSLLGKSSKVVTVAWLFFVGLRAGGSPRI